MSYQETAKGFALTLASTLLIFLSGMTIPFLGIIMIPLVPQPPLSFALKYGRGITSWLLLLAIALLFLFSGGGAALGYTFFAATVVLLLLFIGRDWPVEAVVAATGGGVLITALTVMLSFFGSLSRLQSAARHSLNENLRISLSVYEKAGVPPQTIELARESAPQVVEIILQITPALVFAGLVAIILINLGILAYRYPDSRTLFFSRIDLKEWKAPDYLVWCFILSGFSLFLPSGSGLRTLGLNILLISALFYFFQGLAIVAYFFHHKKVPIFLRSIGYVLIAFQQLFTLFVVGLGLFDLWGDFRRLKKKDMDPTQVT